MILKKTKPKIKQDIREFSLFSVLKSSARFMWYHKKVISLWCFVNFLFLLTFNFIPNGWTNSLSILWLIAYYVYWCVFIRAIQQHNPYFSLIRILNGIIPASKIMFINISIYLLVLVTPYILMFMGFDEKFLEFFEKYMELMQSHDSVIGVSVFYIFMILLSPYTISRPYLAWISSLVGKSRSIINAYKRTHRNYWKFVQCAAVMSLLIAISYYIDVIYNIKTMILIMSILLVYFNIVFTNIYKIFYLRPVKTTKPSSD